MLRWIVEIALLFVVHRETACLLARCIRPTRVNRSVLAIGRYPRFDH